MLTTTQITDLIAAHIAIAAPVAALLVSWLLYGVLGKRLLGADDDFWPALRNRLLPLLHRLGMQSGLYAKAQQTDREFVGIVEMSEEAFERELTGADFYRNPLAAIKRSPQGWHSDGSWARRYGALRVFGDLIRSLGEQLRADNYLSHNLPGWLAEMLGRFCQATGDVFARRQLHVTIYTQVRDGETRLWLYAHDEPNSLNPLTAWRHYRAKSWSAAKGVRKMRAVLEQRGITYTTGSD